VVTQNSLENPLALHLSYVPKASIVPPATAEEKRTINRRAIKVASIYSRWAFSSYMKAKHTRARTASNMVAMVALAEDGSFDGMKDG
jgi:hypothetical protein